jgi:hypothetical protein
VFFIDPICSVVLRSFLDLISEKQRVKETDKNMLEHGGTTKK